MPASPIFIAIAVSIRLCCRRLYDVRETTTLHSSLLFLSLYLPSPPLSVICMCRLNDILSTKLKCAWHTEQASPTRVSFPTSRLWPPAGRAAAAASAACRLSQQIACSCFASQCASFMSLLSVHMYSIYPVLNLNRWCDAT